MTDTEHRKELARRVFASLDGIEPSALRMLAVGLSFAGGSLAQFSLSIDYFADYVEFKFEHGPRLAVLKLSYDLHVVAGRPDCTELVESLEGIDGQPWRALHDALAELRGPCPHADSEAAA